MRSPLTVAQAAGLAAVAALAAGVGVVVWGVLSSESDAGEAVSVPRASSSPIAVRGDCPVRAPDSKSPLGLASIKNVFCWADIEGEAGFELTGHVDYWPDCDGFAAGRDPLRVDFDESLPAGSTAFVLPDTPDQRFPYWKEGRIVIDARASDGSQLASDGQAWVGEVDYSGCPEPWSGVGLKPADGDTPAAGICAGPPTGEVVSFVLLEEGVPSPRCGRALPSQRLRIVNMLDRPISVSVGAFSAELAPEAEATSELPLGAFLAPGVHSIRVDARTGGGPQLWLATGLERNTSATP